MRFDVSSPSRARRIAKSLKTALARNGHPRPLSTCQEAVARMYGHDDWHALLHSTASAPSEPDEVVSPELARQRLSLQVRVLTGMGIPTSVAETIAGEVRPTGGSPLSSFPRLVVTSFEILDDGGARRIGDEDLTWAMVGILRRRRRGADPLAVLDQLMMMDISSALSREASAAGWKSRLKLPDLRRRLPVFLERIGDVADRRVLDAFAERLDTIGRMESDVEDAVRRLRVVEKARFETDLSRFDMFVVEGRGDDGNGFVSDPVDHWFREADDRHAAAVGRIFRREPGYDEWFATAVRNARTMVCPFAFGTIEDVWRGLEPGRIREAVREEAPTDDMDDGDRRDCRRNMEGVADGMIESDMQDHHEDAYEHVVAPEDLLEVFHDWLPHADSGDEIDLAFDAKVVAWNGRQNLRSFRRDDSVILPALEGAIQADAVAWCRRELDATRSELAAMRMWERMPAPSEPEPTLFGGSGRRRPG